MVEIRLWASGLAICVACLATGGCSLVVDGMIDDEAAGGAAGSGGQGGEAGSAGSGGSGGSAGTGGSGGSAGSGGQAGSGGMDGGVAGMDGGAEDAGVDGGFNTGFDCSGETDGTDCGSTRNDDAGVSEPSGLICLEEVCRPSTCGDGYVDDALGEECDDGNDASGDGCEPESCTWSCERDDDCNDGRFCSGTETCDQEAHVCLGGDPQEGEPCETRDGGAGTCSADGYCVPDGCGNGSPDSGEDCDDPSLPGCEYDCTFTCTSDADCDDGDVCNGEETCQCSGGDCQCDQDTCNSTCVGGDELACEDDEDPCTEDYCDPEEGCTHEPVQDEDGDGFVSDDVHASCGDCMDTPNDNLPGIDPADVNPDALEQCDDVDNDCDQAVDEDVQQFTCYRDFDGDEFGTRTVTVEDCRCPAGYVRARSDERFDCIDGRSGSIYASVHPDGNWSRSHYACDTEDCTRDCEASETPEVCASGWDYNCDGTIERRWTRSGASADACRALAGSCMNESGWVGEEAPDCGETGTYVICQGLAGILGCGPTVHEGRRQECR